MDDRVAVREAAGAVKGGVRNAIAHDSAHKHVSGEAVYIDDIPEPPGTLQLYAAQSERAHARIVKLDVSHVRAAHQTPSMSMSVFRSVAAVVAVAIAIAPEARSPM